MQPSAGAVDLPAYNGFALKPLSTHLFTFYFVCQGAIIPPPAVYVTSSLAESNGWTARAAGQT